MNAPVDPAAIASALSRTFPDLGPITIERVLGSGFNSMAVQTTNGLVFRIARAPHVAAGYLLEQRVLPVIRSRLPVAVPGPRWIIERSPDFPFGASGYPMLPGPVLTEGMVDGRNERSLAGDIAELLLAMHRIPPSELSGLGLPGPGSRMEHYRMLREETAPALRERLSSVNTAASTRGGSRSSTTGARTTSSRSSRTAISGMRTCSSMRTLGG